MYVHYSTIYSDICYKFTDEAIEIIVVGLIIIISLDLHCIGPIMHFQHNLNSLYFDWQCSMLTAIVHRDYVIL